MPNPRKPTIAGRRLLQVLWRLVRVYWSSPDARWGALLFALAVTLELGAVYANFRLADAERRIMDALEQKQAARFLAATGPGTGTDRPRCSVCLTTQIR